MPLSSGVVGGEYFRCFVDSLSQTTDDDSLADAFSPYGHVVESKVIRDRDTGRSRCMGYVTYDNKLSMSDAIDQMNGKILDGSRITVNAAQPRAGRGYRKQQNY